MVVQSLDPTTGWLLLCLQATPIFSNGTMMSGWVQKSVGCRACNLTSSDPPNRRAASKASFAVDMAERGSLEFQSLSSHAIDR